MKKLKLYIDNKWVEPGGGKYFTSYCPATGEPLAELASATENDVDILTVEVESKTPLSQVESMDLEECLRNDIKSIIVFTPKVTVLPPNSIMQTGLKAKRVVDERKKV